MSIATVTIAGDQIQAIQIDEAVYAPLRRLCECLGIDHSSQLRKLRSKAWAVLRPYRHKGSDGKQHEMIVLSVAALPLWLSTLNATTISQRSQAKIADYQRHAVELLMKPFANRPASPSAEANHTFATDLTGLLNSVVGAAPTKENPLSFFRFEGLAIVRTAQTDDGEPLLCASDLATALGLARPSGAMTRIDDEFKVYLRTQTQGGPQEMVFLTEAGAYQLISTMRLRKRGMAAEMVKRFRRFVWAEVLPSIRRTGGYGVAAQPVDRRDHLSGLLADRIDERARTLRVFREQQEKLREQEQAWGVLTA